VIPWWSARGIFPGGNAGPLQPRLGWRRNQRRSSRAPPLLHAEAISGWMRALSGQHFRGSSSGPWGRRLRRFPKVDSGCATCRRARPKTPQKCVWAKSKKHGQKVGTMSGRKDRRQRTLSENQCGSAGPQPVGPCSERLAVMGMNPPSPGGSESGELNQGDSHWNTHRLVE